RRGEAGGRRRADEESPRDREEIGLDRVDARPAHVGASEAEEIVAEGAASDAVVDRGLADEPGRWGRRGVPSHEGPDVRGGEEAGEVTGRGGATLVTGEVDGSRCRGDERLGAVRSGHRVRLAG